MSTEISLFSVNLAYEIPGGFDPQRIFDYPLSSQRVAPGTTMVMVRPLYGKRWLGVFADEQAPPYDYRTAFKNGIDGYFIVIAGGRALRLFAADPSNVSELPGYQISGHWVDAGCETALYWSSTEVYAVRENSLVWSNSFYSNNVRVLSVINDIVEIEGSEPGETERLRWRVALNSGSLISS